MNRKKFLISTHGFDMGIGGLKVLHRLCHLLNERGEDAYLIPVDFNQTFGVYEHYNTKMVTQEILDNLEDVIVVYPESWFGNYLNAPNVVRWMIGYPSEDHVKTWNPKDLWFWFIPFYITEKYNKDNDNILCIVEQHKDIFYCYDNYTYISIQSLMCNTDTIIIPHNKTKEEFFKGYELNKYLAYGIDDLPRAKSLRSEFFEASNKIEETTLKQLDTFIEKCYAYFK